MSDEIDKPGPDHEAMLLGHARRLREAAADTAKHSELPAEERKQAANELERLARELEDLAEREREWKNSTYQRRQWRPKS